jgi:hypothetical protein
LYRRQTLIGPLERAILQSFIDRYLIAGHEFPLFHTWHVWATLLSPGVTGLKPLYLPWRILFPPKYPHRFDIHSQIGRLTNLIRRLR